MTPDTMRRIDYWVGIPLCFLVTIWYRVLRFLGLKNPQYDNNPKRILFIELAEMGSTIIAYPAMRKAQELYPDATFYFLLFKQNKATMQVLDVVDAEHTLIIDASDIISFIRDTLRILIICRKRKIDTVINLEMFVRYSTLLSYFSGARKRVGFFRYFNEGMYIGNFLTHKVPYNNHIHTAHSYIALVRALTESSSDIPLSKFSIAEDDISLPVRHPDTKAKDRVWEILMGINPRVSKTDRLIVINPNASKLVKMRKWPLENYAALAKKLSAENGVFIVITGVEEEREEAEYIAKAVGVERAINVAGKTSLTELIDLFSLSHALITNDSGPAHFASLTDTPLFVFFGPETPALYRPLSQNCTVLYSRFACSPCVSVQNQRRTPCTLNACLQSIEVEGVFRKVLEGI
ncbi:MAG: glycosyltransferase family 9 protein [Candidatus Ryanbacteria bacterium CG10_big_fil_rev_8_21_14_0_10_43_42]|uniref:Glycosyltransferase family 9 protein n=1 Tax=Candidatus Ryanbacteria bacterium CG10_big_fil_rev_8_21_14_0_10_43_42 TaxID=1974864 RepID=A0A2M8KWW4_9BACT|nr:MAG: glycosyltransferase family 9 protein [Candidatus Ryanbacteria bacterium CG10_big_fil_rev_8_21_14_0_10_43_42]